MISEAVLDRAVETGVITSGQALSLKSLADSADRDGVEPIDEERLRFVSGFADVFVTLGLVLFLGSAAYLVGRWTSPTVTAAIVATLSWLLAEFFTRRRRMALPSIVLLVVFAGAGWSAIAHLLGAFAQARPAFGWWAGLGNLGTGAPVQGAWAALSSAGLVALHYGRFRVPITVAAGVAALSGAVFMACLAASPEATLRFSGLVTLALGLAVFGLAMRFDLRDPQRATRRTDIAFWLHLLAAPLIVHSLFSNLNGVRAPIEPAWALVVLSVFLALGLVAVVVDRRAILVSGLIYAGLAFGSLIRKAGIADLTLPVTLLVLGAFVLLLSAGWRPLRAMILRMLPVAVAVWLPQPT